MRLREALTSTISHGDLKQSPIEETGTDRIGALGRSDETGAAMLRVTADHDKRALVGAAWMLARKIRHNRESMRFLAKLCLIVIKEWLADKCVGCGGRGYLVAQGVATHVCTVCDGEGVRRHSDAERIRALRIDRRAYPKWESRFADAHDALAYANSEVIRNVARQLDRGRAI